MVVWGQKEAAVDYSVQHQLEDKQSPNKTHLISIHFWKIYAIDFLVPRAQFQKHSFCNSIVINIKQYEI